LGIPAEFRCEIAFVSEPPFQQDLEALSKRLNTAHEAACAETSMLATALNTTKMKE
jgi:hypothetical protein